MTDKICSIKLCGKPVSYRGLCVPHVRRLERYGDPLLGGPPRAASPEEALRLHSRREGECLVWTGALNSEGYGRLRGRGRTLAPHRVAYEVAHGPIPEGAQVDHSCHNRACLEVEHLRLATPAENSSNRGGPRSDRKHRLPRNVYPTRGGSFEVVIKRLGRRHRLGCYETVAEAESAAIRGRTEIFGEFAGNG